MPKTEGPQGKTYLIETPSFSAWLQRRVPPGGGTYYIDSLARPGEPASTPPSVPASTPPSVPASAKGS